MKRCFAGLCLVFILTIQLIPAYANDGVASDVAGEIAGSTAESADTGRKTERVDPMDPETVLGIKDGNYSVDYLGDKLEEKGMDVVYLTKIVGRYICLAGFVICVILIVIGIIGNPRILLRAAIGAVISGVAYALITCGEEIVLLIATWAAS